MNIIVTGASNGIGYQTALLLAKQGHTVFAVARNKVNLEKLKEEAQQQNQKVRLHAFVADITDESSVNKLVKDITAHKESLQVLIHNAGTLINKPFEELALSDWRRIYDTNVFGIVNLTQLLLPYFTSVYLGERKMVRPHIVNISSMGGFQGSAKFKGLSAYSSSKAALVNLTECLAEELKDRNIAVNCLCLGSVQTEMFSAAFPQFKAALTALEMADFIAKFATEGQNLFNGKVIPVSSTTP